MKSVEFHVDSSVRDGSDFFPEKTAIHRNDPSSIARKILPLIIKKKIISVLDYGCGYGEDVKYYRSNGLRAEGWDPHTPFGWSTKPTGTFNLVTIIFVLNVLSNPWERLKVLEEAAKFLTEGGLMIVAARTPEQIEKEAEENEWVIKDDGYWSSESKGTFQRGLSKEEIIQLAKRVNLIPSSIENSTIEIKGVTLVVLKRSHLIR